MIRRPPRSTLFPLHDALPIWIRACRSMRRGSRLHGTRARPARYTEALAPNVVARRSEEHTSELQSHSDLVCRILLEKKRKENTKIKEKQKANTNQSSEA